MTPPPSSTTSVPPFVGLIMRVLTSICLLISFLVIVTNTHTTADDVKIKFKDFYAYRYLVATVIIGMAYTLLQTAFSISLLATGKRPGGDGFLLFEFYGDKFISSFLATGAAASFGMTEELKALLEANGNENIYSKFLNTSNAAASLCLFGFLFSIASSVFSSYNLPKRT